MKSEIEQLIESEIIWCQSLEAEKQLKSKVKREYFIKGLYQALLLCRKLRETNEPEIVPEYVINRDPEMIKENKSIPSIPVPPEPRKIKEGE